ncbi:MAG: ATP synthase F1 subunit gamma [Coriobacteriia bacterium]|nr:ATP synthase F1 subunit gamma [Coriobacteriia bacterium]
MPSLHDVERRIKSVSSTRQITSTMQMISATKVGKSNSRLELSQPYKQSITDIMNNIQSSNGCSLLEKHDDIKTTLLVVIVSDKGLAGGFNSNILHLAQKYLDDNKRAGKATKVIVCGKKAASYFNFRNIQTELEFIGTSEEPQYIQAEEIGNYCIDNYLNGNIDEAFILYNKCKNNIEQTVVDSMILPIESNELEESNNSDMEYEPNESAVLEGLIPLYIKTLIYNALLDSAAGEQIARRVAMQNATDSADEMIETLTRLYNSVRQGAITTELNEIVGGADAAKDS